MQSGAAHGEEAERRATYHQVGWRILPILFAAYIMANLDRNNFAFAKLQFASEFGFSEAVYGFGAGLFYLGYSLFEVPSNLMLAKVGARLTLLRIMLFWSLCSGALAFMSSATHFYALRFLLGVAEAGFFPGVLLYLTHWAPTARRAGFTALFMSALTMAGVIGGPIAGVILQSFDGALGLRGWQWLFLVEAVPAALLGIAVYLHLDDRPEQASWLSPSRKAMLMQDLAAEAKAKRAHGHSSFLLALRDRRFYMLAGMAVALISGLAGLNIWLPTIIRNAGTANLLDIGLLSSLPYTVGVLAQLANGWHSDRTQERRWHAALPALAAGVGWCALPLATGHAGLSLALTILISVGSFAATAPFWTLPSLYLSETAAAGGIATITTLGGLGAFVSPAVVGFLTSETGSLAFGQCYYGLLLCLGAGMLVLGTRVPSPAAVRPPPAETVATS